MVGHASSAKAEGGRLGFHKYEGLGNDFVVVDAGDVQAVSVERARELCDRRLGIGADGVLLVLPPKSAGADARMVVINADGSVPEMCGNGLRCVALHVARQRGLHEGSLTFDTDAGTKPARSTIGTRTASSPSSMGVVRWTEDVSLDLDGDACGLRPRRRRQPARDHAAPRHDGPDPACRSAHREKHPRFPAGTNVEFAVMRSPTEIDLVVWERGVGITQACGIGALRHRRRRGDEGLVSGKHRGRGEAARRRASHPSRRAGSRDHARAGPSRVLG